MRLLVDMGNSSIKWAILEQKQLSPQQRWLYQDDSLDNILSKAWLKLEPPSDGVWVSNVAGQDKADILSHWLSSHWAIQPNFIKTSDYECGVKNAYNDPKQLGVDRWLALIGAHHLEKGMLCVVDCGTAVTLDVLSANGFHQGGLIMPGITTMQQALLNNTSALAQLNKVDQHDNNTTFLAHDTHTGMNLGALYAVIGFINYQFSLISDKYKKGQHKKKSLKLILTGGSVPALESLLDIPYKHIPDLVLQGMLVLVNQRL